MEDLTPLRIGIVGAGANTRERHLPGFLGLAEVEVTVVANRSRASSQRVADEFSIARIAPDWRAVVADPAVDAVCIGTWPYLHAEISCAALAAGKHVLTEARMARNATEAETMLVASQARPDLIAQVVPSPMTLRVDATIRRMIAEGELGDLREIGVTHTTGNGADSSAPMSWRQDFELSGHNTMSLGIYYEAVLRWMQEEVEVVHATASIHTPQRRRRDGSTATVRIPDSLTVLGRYAQGARLVMQVSAVERGLPRNEIRIHGSRGSLRLDVATEELWWCPASGLENRLEISADRNSGWQVEADFVDSIRNGAPVRLTDFATGLRTMRFTDAVWSAWSDE